jgi:hypothetical protein
VSIYNPLLKFLKEGKLIKEGKAIKESETMKAFAKPTAIGAGVGVGGYTALRGVGEGIESLGASSVKEATQKFTGLLMFIAIVMVLIFSVRNLRLRWRVSP